MGGTTVLIDYFASDCPGRATAAPIPAEEVKGIDGFAGTHDPLDHIDHGAWRIWASSCPDAKFVFPSIHRLSILEDRIPRERQLPMDAGQCVQIGEMAL